MLPSVNTAKLLEDVANFLPEALLCAAIVVMLLVRLGSARMHLGGLAFAVTAVALSVAVFLWVDRKETAADAFGNMLAFDSLTIFARFIILGAALLTIVLTMITGIPDADDSADFYTLLLGGTLGMLLMASANHLLMVFIAVEMASLPSYALAGFLKGKRQGSEAALKYVVYGGGASGVMLFGISLLAGRFGTGYLPDLAKGYTLALAAQAGGHADPVLVLGSLLILVGLAFKLSAVPFHFWCPDVFEGAAAEVSAFLSVASKAGAFVLTARLVLSMTVPPAGFGAVAMFFGPPLAFLAALTATFGNLAAYPQTNLKRLLAYSTIAHAGYMLMGLATVNAEGVQAVLFYLATYVFMNLGAFAVVAFLRNQTGSEDLAAFRGLIYRSPGAVVLLGIFLLSLLGIPPLVGFMAKFQIFAAVFHAGREAPVPWLGGVYYALLVIGGINTAVSAVYYVRVLRVMILDKSLDEVEGRVPIAVRLPAPAAAYGGFLAAVVIGLGVAWNFLAAASAQGVKQFVREEPPAIESRPARSVPGGRRPAAPRRVQPAIAPKAADKGTP